MTEQTTAPEASGGEHSPAPVTLTEGEAWGRERSIFGKAVDMVRDAAGRFAGKREEPAPAPDVAPAQPQAPAPAAVAPPAPVAPTPAPAPAPQPAPVAAQPAPQPPAPPPAPPNLFEDPEGYQAWQQQQLVSQRVEMSAMVMRSLPQYQDYDAMEAVFAEVARAEAEKGNTSLVAQMLASPNPAMFAYEQGKRLTALKEWGDDPSQYLTKAQEKLFSDPAKLVEAVTANPALVEALRAALAPAAPAPAQQPAPSNVTPFPPSLATARSSGGRAAPAYAPPAEGEVWGRKRKS